MYDGFMLIYALADKVVCRTPPDLTRLDLKNDILVLIRSLNEILRSIYLGIKGIFSGQDWKLVIKRGFK